jgi:colanic acid/amylovoran biosynthesis glycosyltransferase
MAELRIAWLLERFPATSETFIVTQLIALLRAGHDVSIVSQHRPWPDEPVHDAVTSSGLLDVTSYAERRLEIDMLEEQPWVPLARAGQDILHAHFGPNARRFLFARAQAHAPLVVTFHGYDFSAQPVAHGASMYERLFEVADVVTFNCDYARRALERLGCPPEKLALLRVGIDLDAFAFRPRQRVNGRPLRILSVGRLVEKKGYDIALRALATARAELPDVRYDIVGDGPLAGRLQDVVHRLRLEQVVSLHGARPDREVRRLLDEADLFVLASTTARDGDQEGTPVSLMEAQASGIPVVSTRHSGIPEVVVDGRSGLVVEEGDPEALAAGIIRLARAPETWPELGAAGRAHIQSHFDIRLCAEQHLDVYRHALRRFAADAELP